MSNIEAIAHYYPSPSHDITQWLIDGSLLLLPLRGQCWNWIRVEFRTNFPFNL